jgi:hypothetical protein
VDKDEEAKCRKKKKKKKEKKAVRRRREKKCKEESRNSHEPQPQNYVRLGGEVSKQEGSETMKARGSGARKERRGERAEVTSGKNPG